MHASCTLRNEQSYACRSEHIFDGAPGRTRTCDLEIRRLLLYPLSYEGWTARKGLWEASLGRWQDWCVARCAQAERGGHVPNARVATTSWRGRCPRLRGRCDEMTVISDAVHSGPS